MSTTMRTFACAAAAVLLAPAAARAEAEMETGLGDPGMEATTGAAESAAESADAAAEAAMEAAEDASEAAAEAAQDAGEAAMEAAETAATEAEEAAEAAEEMARDAAEPAARGRVVRATFTTDVIDREPQDSISRLENDHVQVIYFSELRGFQGQTVTHRWEHEGEVKAEVPFEVGGPRWRVYSSKNLDDGWLGQWTVTVVDDAGRELRSDTLVYSEVTLDPDPEIEAPDEQESAAETGGAAPAAPTP